LRLILNARHHHRAVSSIARYHDRVVSSIVRHHHRAVFSIARYHHRVLLSIARHHHRVVFSIAQHHHRAASSSHGIAQHHPWFGIARNHPSHGIARNLHRAASSFVCSVHSVCNALDLLSRYRRSTRTLYPHALQQNPGKGRNRTCALISSSARHL
jgi:D-hexose-6-phosphate mutarotase